MNGPSYDQVRIFLITILINFLINIKNNTSNKTEKRIDIKSESIGDNQQIIQAENGSVNIQISDLHIEKATPQKSANIELVDIFVDNSNKTPHIEFKIRNNSDEVAFIKKAEIKTIGQWDIPKPGAQPSAVPVSWTYDVSVPATPGSTANYNISQGVPPQSADRFRFSVLSDHDSYPYVGLFVFLIQIILIYNEDDKKLITPSILMYIPPQVELRGLFSPPYTRETVGKNQDTAKNLMECLQKDTIADTELFEAIESWIDVDISQFPE